MSQAFILQNQHKQFLSKQLDWVDGRDAGSLYKTPHRDEALNQMFEVNAKDYSQRIKLLECSVSDRGGPLLDPELLPPLMPEPTADSTADIHAGSEKQDASLADEYEGNESLFLEKTVE